MRVASQNWGIRQENQKSSATSGERTSSIGDHEMQMESRVPSIDEFNICEGTYFGGCGACEENILLDSKSVESSSFWEWTLKTHFPLALLWLKRGFFAITMLVRTLILGHLLCLVFGDISERKEDWTPSWRIEVLQSFTTSHPRLGAQAWPPPALVVLALLTLVTLVVHPDGLTWVLFGKIKSGVLSVTASLSECWQVLIADYGALQSTIAAMTIAGLFYVVFAMLRSSISPRRTRKNCSYPDKKKKKRKGHARHRSGKSRTPSSPVRSFSTSNDPTADSSIDGVHSSHDEHAPDLALLTPVSSPRQLHVSDQLKPDNDTMAFDDLAETTRTWPHDVVSNSSSVAMENSISGRSRVTSVSTIDTSIMSDDLSCSSKSILSIPSESVGCTKSADRSTISSLPMLHSHDSKSDQGKPSVLLSHGKCGGNFAATGTVALIMGERKSRWDALKPGQNPKTHPHQHDRQSQAKNGEKQLRQRQVGPHRPHNRKIERAAVVGSKGRSGGHKTPTTTNGLAVGSSDNRFNAQSAVSPAVLDVAILDGVTDIFTLPPPPPGLGPITSSTKLHHRSDVALSCEKPSLPTSSTRSQLPTCSWHLPTTLGTETFVRSFPLQQKEQYMHPLTDPTTAIVDSPVRLEFGTPFPEPVPLGFGPGARSLKENPFAPESLDSEEQIEADLQALGGQMAGSILDF